MHRRLTAWRNAGVCFTLARMRQPYNLVISCEHATNTVPPNAPSLGVGEDVLASHVAWDPGARELAQALATELAAPLVLGTHTRLLADLNRSPTSPQVVPACAFGVEIPGNRDLHPDAVAWRLTTFHQPYWRKVQAIIDQMTRQCGGCRHLSIHSFTPELDPPNRTFNIGLLFDPAAASEQHTAELLAAHLRGCGYSVEFNRPYLGTHDGLTVAERQRMRGTAYEGIEIEINQSLMTDGWLSPLAQAVAGGVQRWLEQPAC